MGMNEDTVPRTPNRHLRCVDECRRYLSRASIGNEDDLEGCHRWKQKTDARSACDRAFHVGVTRDDAAMEAQLREVEAARLCLGGTGGSLPIIRRTRGTGFPGPG